jgi:hypothetical protein
MTINVYLKSLIKLIKKFRMKKAFYLLWCFLIVCSQHLLKAETAPMTGFLIPEGTLNAYAIGNQQLNLASRQFTLYSKWGLLFRSAPPLPTKT